MTKLNYEEIKKSLREHYNKDSSPFQDHDHYGRTADILLSVLSRNSEILGFYSSMSVTEQSPRTARLRSSLNTHAMIEGILPINRRAASCQFVLDVDYNNPQSVTPIRKGHVFNTTDRTNETMVATRVKLLDRPTDTSYKFEVVAAEGRIETQIIKLDYTTPSFIITDPAIDITTLNLYVSNTPNSHNGDKLTTNVDMEFKLPEFIPQVVIIQKDDKYELLVDPLVVDEWDYIHAEFLSTSGFNGNNIKTDSLSPSDNGDLNSYNLSFEYGESRSYGGINVLHDTEKLRSIILNGKNRHGTFSTEGDYLSYIEQYYPTIRVFGVTGGNEYTGNKYGEVAIFAMNKPISDNAPYTKISNNMKSKILGELYTYNPVGVTINFHEPIISKTEAVARNIYTNEIINPWALIEDVKYKFYKRLATTDLKGCDDQYKDVNISFTKVVTEFNARNRIMLPRIGDAVQIDAYTNEHAPFTVDVNDGNVQVIKNVTGAVVGYVKRDGFSTIIQFRDFKDGVKLGEPIKLTMFGEWEGVKPFSDIEYFTVNFKEV